MRISSRYEFIVVDILKHVVNAQQGRLYQFTVINSYFPPSDHPFLRNEAGTEGSIVLPLKTRGVGVN